MLTSLVDGQSPVEPDGLVRPLTGNWVAKLQRFVRPPVERCALCGAVVPDEHPHLLEIARRRPVCACTKCAAAIAARAEGAFRAVPPMAETLPGFVMTDAEWGALQIPIGMAFLFHSSAEGGPMAIYPGPAGGTETPLHGESWADIVANNPRLAAMAPDVEALLVNRVGQRREYHLVSIDRCFTLISLFRMHWRGLSGGDKVWTVIDDYFAGLTRPGAASLSHG